MTGDKPNMLSIPGEMPFLNINCGMFGKLFGNLVRKVWTSSPVPTIVCVCMKNEGGQGEMLKEEFIKRGFSLYHPDDHTVLLMHESEQVAMFSQTGGNEGMYRGGM